MWTPPLPRGCGLRGLKTDRVSCSPFRVGLAGNEGFEHTCRTEEEGHVATEAQIAS